jgi:hypothetical protein
MDEVAGAIRAQGSTTNPEVRPVEHLASCMPGGREPPTSEIRHNHDAQSVEHEQWRRSISLDRLYVSVRQYRGVACVDCRSWRRAFKRLAYVGGRRHVTQ